MILKAGVGLMSIVPQGGQDDRHVNDDPSSLRKSIRDQKTVNISDISRKVAPCYADIHSIRDIGLKIRIPGPDLSLSIMTILWTCKCLPLYLYLYLYLHLVQI